MHTDLLERLDTLYKNVLRKLSGDADSHDAMRQLIEDLRAALTEKKKPEP